jgi:amino acid transporter
VVDELVQGATPFYTSRARLSNDRRIDHVRDGWYKARRSNKFVQRARGDSVATAQVEERQLLKAMSWWDGFVVALANPGFLIAALGASIGVLGTTGAVVLWTVSVVLGALQNNIYAELATMFPEKSGGISLFAHEAWRKYLTFVGPVATFGYWFAWSSVLAINGLVVGTLIQAEWFSDTTWSTTGAGFDLSLPILIGCGAILLVWITNIFGIRPAVWLSYVTGALLLIPVAVLMFLPYVTGDWSSDNMQWNLDGNGGLMLALTWLYFMGWSSYGFETVAVFAPEYRDPTNDTPLALRASAGFSVIVYALLPLGLGGTLGTQAVTDDATFIAFYTTAFDTIVGSALGNVMVVCLIAGLLLSMNTATMDGSRALFGISRDGMTIKELGVLNTYHVPARAMTLDALLNVFLITYFASAIEIIAAGNLGYMLAHVFALAGFVLLRRDRPNWPRPIRLSAVWAPIAGTLAVLNLAFVVIGGFIYSGGFLGIDTQYGYGWDKTRVGLLVLLLSLALYVFRHVVQDRTKLRLREDVPAMPPAAADSRLTPA